MSVKKQRLTWLGPVYHIFCIHGAKYSQICLKRSTIGEKTGSTSPCVTDMLEAIQVVHKMHFLTRD